MWNLHAKYSSFSMQKMQDRSLLFMYRIDLQNGPKIKKLLKMHSMPQPLQLHGLRQKKAAIDAIIIQKSRPKIKQNS